MGFTKQQTMQMATDPESARNAMMAVTSSAERAINAPSSMARQRSEFTSLEKIEKIYTLLRRMVID